MLYDESDKLLECRMLRRDEVVSSAQTLTFAAYFVDVGLLQSPPYLNFSDARKKGNEVKPIDRSLSPSQKIIRVYYFDMNFTCISEFKKNELQKYVALQTGPTTTKASVTVIIPGESISSFAHLVETEWQVLYTTQVAQKAKKYHDGFLKLVNSAALQRQIMLYDGSKKLINSRFLNKDEVIQPGESITFDAHLVNIGEAEGNHPGLMDSDVHVSNYNAAGKTEMIHRVQNRLKTRKSFLKGKPQKIASSKVYSDPSFSIPIIAETKSSQNISADKPLRDATQILSILRKPMIQVGIATQSIDKNVMNPVSSVKDPQNSYSTKNFIECSQLQEISIAHHGSSGKLDNIESNECIDIKIPPDIYSKGNFSGNKSSKNTEVGNLHQVHSENLESYTKCCNEESVLGSWSRAAETCHDRVGVMEDCTEVKNSREAVPFSLLYSRRFFSSNWCLQVSSVLSFVSSSIFFFE
ncbi:Glycosyl transferase, family 31 [Gossypium australe]|uniref:Glycosyl transferase, family 31 n=1 Tax=Gossypium australe TaxID=47621 RepID=A0A5B6WU68_9ROSI|nr:Glycosyl transferase, family 31 [Gossypium australe]